MVQTVSARASRRLWQQARLFVKADGIDGEAGSLRDLSNLEFHSRLSEHTVWSSLQSQAGAAWGR
jgi:hypothetical protein